MSIFPWRRRPPRRPRPGPGRRLPEAIDRGSVSVEVAVLAPAFLALVVVAAVAGRTAVANEAIDAAAHDAARAASISRTETAARNAALAAARERLNWAGLSCTAAPAVTLTGRVGTATTSFTAAFNSPLGTDASVVVTVACQVRITDLHMSFLPGMPNSKLVSATFTSPLDRYRTRSN
jgi:Flp pilus assembly protein TadG